MKRCRRHPQPKRSYPVLITCDIPIPAEDSHYRYPLSTMKIGESFLEPLMGDSLKVLQSRILSAIRYFKHHVGNESKVFITRRYPDGVRCWRVR